LRLLRGFYCAFHFRDTTLKFLRFNCPSPNFQEVSNCTASPGVIPPWATDFSTAPAALEVPPAVVMSDGKRSPDRSFATWGSIVQAKLEQSLPSVRSDFLSHHSLAFAIQQRF
jgi:hypothetical protein